MMVWERILSALLQAVNIESAGEDAELGCICVMGSFEFCGHLNRDVTFEMHGLIAQHLKSTRKTRRCGGGVSSWCDASLAILSEPNPT